MAEKNNSNVKELAEKIEGNIKDGNYPATVEGARKFFKDMFEMLGKPVVEKAPQKPELTFLEILNIMAEVVGEWDHSHSPDTSGPIIK